MMIRKPDEVLTFWADAGAPKWFKKDTAFDASIEEHFKDSFELACNGAYDDWAHTPDGALALVIMLDQFSRNLYRGSPQAFAQDAKALKIAKKAIADGLDRKMPEKIGHFIYLPLMHSEDLDDQKRSVSETKRIENDPKWAIEHMEIIERFGRFPHRNVLLGRQSTEQELKFLEDGGFAG